MSRLDKIDKEAGDCKDGGDAAYWMKDYAALLIRAVRQLGGVLIGCNHSAGIGQVNDTTCPECIGMESLDSDVLELIANLEQGANEQD